MTVLASNTYFKMEDGTFQQMVTGIIGVFEDRNYAMKVWNDKLKELDVPEEEFDNYGPLDPIGNTLVELDENGKWTDDDEKVKFAIELMSKDTEMNKVLTIYDSIYD